MHSAVGVAAGCFGIGTLEIVGFLSFLGHIGQLGHGHLHAIDHFVLLDASLNLAVTDIIESFLIEA